MDNDFNELSICFTLHLKVKNYAPSSIKGYVRELLRFFKYLGEKKITDIKQVTKDTIKAYQADITEKKNQDAQGYTIATVSLKIRALKRFFGYLEASNHILINPAESIKEAKKETRLPRVILTEDEVRKILDQPDLSLPTGIRDRAILEVFYGTGIRLEEMVNLSIFDCDLQGGLLRVNKGKFAKDRVVPLGRHAVRFLKKYITQIRPLHTKKNKSSRTLFVRTWGGQMSKRIIYNMIKAFAEKAGIEKHVTSHVFRHTFATELIRNGADIRAVQKMLGHSSLSATYIYTHVAGREVKKTHQHHHPRERDKPEKETVTPDTKGYYHAKPV